MADRLRVLVSIPALRSGGPDRVMFELLCALDRRRFEPYLLVLEDEGRYLSMLPSDVHVEALGLKPGLAGRYPLFKTLRHIRSVKPDIVLATQNMTLTIGVLRNLLPSNCRLVLRQANDVSADFAVLVKQSWFKHRLARQISFATLRGADAIVCQSVAMQRDLRRSLGARANLRVISNPIDVDRVRSDTATVKLSGAPALVAVGRLSAQKGYDILLAAIAKVRPSHPNLHLTIVGDGPDRESLKRLASELGLTAAVTFAGFQNGPLAMVRGADLFVLASRYEGFPNAALEALACGTPVVLTDCPGANSEIVREGINGKLALAVSPDGFAAALDSAIREVSSFDREAITADCAERFGADRIVAQYQRLFETVSGAN